MRNNMELINEIISKYGKDKQCMIAMEECSELVQAISKCLRYDNQESRLNLIEEIADVLFCIDQLQMMYQINDEEIYAMKQAKMNRMKVRLNQMKQVKNKHNESKGEKELIPVTERLPEEDGEYLVYYSQEIDKSVGDECECGYSVEMYDAEQKAFGCWNLVLDGYTLGVVDDEFTSMDTVVAWMPLPKPYRGKENE